MVKLARLFFAVAILGGLLFFVGAKDLASAFANLEFKYIVYLLLIGVANIWISCVKWQVFVRASGHNAKILELMKYYTIGYFFNIFLPAYVGGDIARSVHLGKQLENPKDAFISTFLERFTGFLAMCALGVVFVFYGSSQTKGFEPVLLALGIFAIVPALMCFFRPVNKWCFKTAFILLQKAPLGKREEKVFKFVRKLEHGMGYALNNKFLLVKALLLSFTFHLFAVVNTYVAALAVGWDGVIFSDLFVVLPLILLVGMVPLTPNGLGVQEGAFLFFLQRIGASQAEGLGVGLVLRAKVLFIALLGGVLLFFVKSKAKQASAVNAEQATQAPVV